MDLTDRYIQDGRRVIAEVEAADVTNPDLPRPDVAVLVTRLTETLRTTTDHTERLGVSLGQARAENAELEQQVRTLHEALAQPAA
ncbi:hypothetical protein MUK60_07500 [Streptomyces sp. LRE541]|uniref:hypothetical protein n=1 Tax=Streptomyces sp. LRE541 TaxID=2931983 RepID=UPI00200EEBDD|nr:hypothetical protein [Streptomyces sp. LRE541]UPZ27678.1 hypothetical protein MUK60_07500 [Streptomyces sp. LRE541]